MKISIVYPSSYEKNTKIELMLIVLTLNVHDENAETHAFVNPALSFDLTEGNLWKTCTF